jgi:chromosome segregation ATPase
MSISNIFLGDWASAQLGRIEELSARLQALDEEYSKLLQARQAILAEIGSLEKRVRPMVQSALALGSPK